MRGGIEEMKRKSEIIEYSENDPGLISFSKEDVTELKNIVNDHGEIYLKKTNNNCMVRVFFLRRNVNSDCGSYYTFPRKMISSEVPAKVNSFGWAYVGRGFNKLEGIAIIIKNN